MPGKGHVPDLVERLIRGQRAGTSRTAGGFARGASPQMVRDRMAASLKGSGLTSTVQRSSMIDPFEIVDDTESSFALSHTPLFDSWNVSLSWSLEDGADYGIVGRTLTVVDPTALFRGIADNGPRILQVQYDYLTGVPVTPGAFVGGGQGSREITPGTPGDFWLADYDASAWDSHPTDEIAYSGGVFPAQTYAWTGGGAGSELEVRCFVVATPGSPVTLTYSVDDSMDLYWNEALMASPVGAGVYVIPGADVLDNNLLAIKAANSLGGPGWGLVVGVAT